MAASTEQHFEERQTASGGTCQFNDKARRIVLKVCERPCPFRTLLCAALRLRFSQSRPIFVRSVPLSSRNPARAEHTCKEMVVHLPSPRRAMPFGARTSSCQRSGSAGIARSCGKLLNSSDAGGSGKLGLGPCSAQPAQPPSRRWAGRVLTGQVLKAATCQFLRETPRLGMCLQVWRRAEKLQPVTVGIVIVATFGLLHEIGRNF